MFKVVFGRSIAAAFLIVDERKRKVFSNGTWKVEAQKHLTSSTIAKDVSRTPGSSYPWSKYGRASTMISDVIIKFSVFLVSKKKIHKSFLLLFNWIYLLIEWPNKNCLLDVNVCIYFVRLMTVTALCTIELKLLNAQRKKVATRNRIVDEKIEICK